MPTRTTPHKNGSKVPASNARGHAETSARTPKRTPKTGASQGKGAKKPMPSGL